MLHMVLWISLFTGAVPGACGAAEPPADPAGVLRKPIPDKIVVLTFDDGPLSGYTVVAPILKSLGFNGSFYVCDFDSFKTRKDWYMTFRQMQAMADAGFEIGNHSKGHSPGLDAMLAMEDALLANHVPKPTTIAWPLHQANVTPELAAAGYIFARGGHNRAYRPTVDNPFEIPSMWCNDLDGFVKMVRQAAGGKIVAICYHGVPDMEHPPVSLAPEVFKVQMQYLKDNNYKVIALRDLAEYIDPAKAAKLPPTARDFKDPGPVVLASEEKPCGAVKPVVPDANNAGNAPAAEKPKPKPPAAVGVVTPIDTSRPNVFTWSKADGGNWSDASKWSNNQGAGVRPVSAGQADYVLNFDQRGACAVKNDLQAGFLLNQLVLGDGCGGMVLSGNGMTFAKGNSNKSAPEIRAGKCQRVDINVPVILQDDLSVNTIPDKDPNCFISFNDVISGPRALVLNSSGDPNVPGINFHDVHFGILQINNSNTYSGGTRINGGKINVRKNDGLGTGPVTLDNFGTLSTDGTLANPLVINSGTLFHCAWSGPVKLNCIANFISDCDISGAMSGPGGFSLLGTNGTYLSMVPGGTVTLRGSNTYSGPTSVFPGTLIVKKAAGLYNGDTAKWTPTNITVHKSATLRLNVGGPDEFSGAQISALLANLTTNVNHNGLLAGSVLALDTTAVKEPVAVTANVADSKGPGGGAFLFKKCGAGALQLTGKNTYTGQTILESGTLIVNSLNSCSKANAKSSSSLGAPMDIEAGEIVIGDDGKDGDCTLIYNGSGETSDRVINLAGKKSTVTLTQSGPGLLKLASPFVISGFGANKTIALTGDTAGTGELAGTITNPHDRAGKATTALTKSGKGTWTLSGANSYTGPTLVNGGTLVLTTLRGLGPDTEVSIAAGATLELNFKGLMKVRKLSIDGKPQPAGTYNATSSPKALKGTGVLNVQP
jgi:autotransporter-associated beta strand protein